jgi:hypothetical protein
VLADLQTTYFKFFVRLDPVESNERVLPTTTLLDLFGRFGAVFSFLSTLTIGFLTLRFNRWSFRKEFEKTLEDGGVPAAARDLRLFDRHVRCGDSGDGW